MTPVGYVKEQACLPSVTRSVHSPCTIIPFHFILDHADDFGRQLWYVLVTEVQRDTARGLIWKHSSLGGLDIASAVIFIQLFPDECRHFSRGHRSLVGVDGVVGRHCGIVMVEAKGESVVVVGGVVLGEEWGEGLSIHKKSH